MFTVLIPIITHKKKKIMKAPIYISPGFYDRIQEYAGEDYYGREKFKTLPYNHLALDLQPLPASAIIHAPEKVEYSTLIEGVVFAGSGDKIAKNYDERLAYWNGATGVNPPPSYGAVFYQNSKFRVGPQEESFYGRWTPEKQAEHDKEQAEKLKDVVINPVTYVVSESRVFQLTIPDSVLEMDEDIYLQVNLEVEFGPWEDGMNESIADVTLLPFFFKVGDLKKCPDNHTILFEPFMSQGLDYGYHY